MIAQSKQRVIATEWIRGAGRMTKDSTNKDRGTLKSCRQQRSRAPID